MNAHSIAAPRRRRGYATAAVGAIVNAAPALGVTTVRAETSVTNAASERVLERNGFERVGRNFNPADGELTLWRRSLPAG